MENMPQTQWTSYAVPKLPPPPTSPVSSVDPVVAVRRDEVLIAGAGQGAQTGAPDLAHLVARLKDYRQMPNAALEVAQLPTEQMVQVAQAIFRDPSMTQVSLSELLVAGLSKRVPDPAVLDTLRLFLDSPANPLGGAALAANTRAAMALIHFGTIQDLPRVLKLLPSDLGGSFKLRKLLIDHIGAKPEWAHHPVTTDILIALVMRDQFMVPMDAARVLGKTPSTKARDALGESPWLSGEAFGPRQELEVLGYLAQHRGPYSPRTRENLRRLTSSTNAAVAQKAQELLKR